MNFNNQIILLQTDLPRALHLWIRRSLTRKRRIFHVWEFGSPNKCLVFYALLRPMLITPAHDSCGTHVNFASFQFKLNFVMWTIHNSAILYLTDEKVLSELKKNILQGRMNKKSLKLNLHRFLFFALFNIMHIF